MKLVIQRVSEASVAIDGETKGQIGRGFMVLIGVGQEDTKETADKYIKKNDCLCVSLRMKTARPIYH